MSLGQSFFRIKRALPRVRGTTRVDPGSSQGGSAWNQSDLKSLCDGTRVKFLKMTTKQGETIKKITTKQGGTRVKSDLPWFRHKAMRMNPSSMKRSEQKRQQLDEENEVHNSRARAKKHRRAVECS